MKRDRSASQSETIRLAIEAEIVLGSLKPGSRLDEDAIARRFDVSRTPVREAILKLAHSGLIERLPRKGSVVAQTDIKKLVMAFEFMSELEGLCARLATRRMTDSERQALIQTHDATEEAFARAHFDDYYTQSHKFHMRLIYGTHNDEIIAVANRIGIRLIPYRRFQLGYPGRSEANLKDHREILAAVLAGDADKASSVMKQHTTLQGDAMAEYILTASTGHSREDLGSMRRVDTQVEAK